MDRISSKDCIDIVRSYLSQLDFLSVLNELEIATNSERNWVHDCNNIRPFGSSPVASLDNVKEYITSKFCYRVEPYVQVTELFVHLKMRMIIIIPSHQLSLNCVNLLNINFLQFTKLSEI